MAARTVNSRPGPRVHVATTDESARACPTCGVVSTVRKDRPVTAPRHLPYGGRTARIRWHKSRGHGGCCIAAVEVAGAGPEVRWMQTMAASSPRCPPTWLSRSARRWWTRAWGLSCT